MKRTQKTILPALSQGTAIGLVSLALASGVACSGSDASNASEATDTSASETDGADTSSTSDTSGVSGETSGASNTDGTSTTGDTGDTDTTGADTTGADTTGADTTGTDTTGTDTGDTDTGGSLDEELRPESGTVLLDLTREDHANWFLEHAKPFFAADHSRADDMIFTEWAGDRGVCIATSKSDAGLGIDVIGGYFDNPVNYYELGEPIPAREDTPETVDACDTCIGLTIPYFSPKSLKVTLSSINISPFIDDQQTPPPADEDNLNEIFVDSPEVREEIARARLGNRGFVGLITRIPAREDGTNVIVDPDVLSTYEFVYLRPANGDTTPGDFFGNNLNTVVQYGARYFEWFVLRTSAYGDDLGHPVFEGTATTNFGDTDVASLTTDTNVLELTLTDETIQEITVNGGPVVSSVTNEVLDRTMLGGYEPNNSPETTSALHVGQGVYGCFQKIELEI